MSAGTPRSPEESSALRRPAGGVADGAATRDCRRQIIRGAVHLECSFAFVRPKCDFGTGRNADKLKESAPKHHAKKPDVSKLVRAIEDSLKGVVWADDSQVCEVVANKFYGEPARAWVQVREIE